MSGGAAYPFRGFRVALFPPTVLLMRLGGLFLWTALVLAALAATNQISLDGALAGWETLAAKLATVAH